MAKGSLQFFAVRPTAAIMRLRHAATKRLRPQNLIFIYVATSLLSLTPANAIPQWITVGESTTSGPIKIDFNSIKRDGQRVGFTSSLMIDGRGIALMTWVDCDSWQYQFEESTKGWERIAADTIIESAATYACSKSKPSIVSKSGTEKQLETLPKPQGIPGKCTFLSSTGNNSVINDSCKINRQGSTTTLFWSDKVYTEMKITGNQVSISSAGGSPYLGRVVSKSSIGGAIEYENGTIKWCWAC
jgi:hypothetical protein